MRSVLHPAAAALALALAASPAIAQTVLDFEDLSTPTCCDPMPTNYGGISWDANFGYYSFAQPPFNAKSGSVRVRTNQVAVGMAEVFFQFLSPTVFHGAWFAGTGVTVQFNSYLGATLVGSSAVLATTSTPTFLASGFAGTVDRIGIVGNRGQYVFDDLTFDGTSVVPEPATVGLLGIGVLLIGAARRRRRLPA